MERAQVTRAATQAEEAEKKLYSLKTEYDRVRRNKINILAVCENQFFISCSVIVDSTVRNRENQLGQNHRNVRNRKSIAETTTRRGEKKN